MDYGKLGILQFDDVRYAVSPLRSEQSWDGSVEITLRVVPDMFPKSNELVKRGIAYLREMSLRRKKNGGIQKVIFNDPATVVIWEDGSKTVVKCQPNDEYSKETGLAMCIAKKYLGNKGNFNEVFKQFIEGYDPREK